MVSIIGSVPSEPRHFVVETSVYEASKAAPITFSVVCFLEDTKRWEKVKTPPPGAFLSVTAKLAGRTANTNRLALRIRNLAYLPRPNSGAAGPTPTTTPPSKRSRWDGRAPSTPSTPSKRLRISKPVEESDTPSNKNTILLDGKQAEPNLPPTGDAVESPFVTSSPSTAANHEESSVDPIPPSSSDNAAQPHRSRHPPRKYAELDYAGWTR